MANTLGEMKKGHIKLSLLTILGLPTLPNSVPVLAGYFTDWIGPDNCLHRLGIIKVPQAQWPSRDPIPDPSLPGVDACILRLVQQLSVRATPHNLEVCRPHTC